MRPLAFACLAALLSVTPTPAVQADTAYQVEEIRFRAPDGVELAGSLLVPMGEGPFPGAVIIHGSGSSDRSNVWADAFARVLARSGVAVLLPDKRGSGESGGDWLTASFETLAGDALAGVDLVAAHPKVDPREVGVVGLSQGGHVAPLAADLSDDVAWVVDVSGATVPMIEQIRHEMANTARNAGLSPEGIEAVLAIQRAAERYVETGEWDPYAAALDAAEGTPWAEVAAGFPQSPDSPVWTWARLNGAYDPTPHWKSLDVPILVFYGAEDESDNVPVAESVRRLEAALAEADHEDHDIRVVPGAGHGIWAPDVDHSAHDHRLHPDLVEGLTAWIDERFGGGDGADTTFQVEEMRFVASDGVELAGSLYVPSGKGPFPGAVIIQGSGSSDRTNLWARTFAETLARAGVATLLPDKRGSGESGGSWLTAGFETLARDALAGVERVMAHPSVDGRAVGLVGLSQGGYVAPLAAALSADVAWVVDVSGAAVPIDAQIRHELGNTARKAGLDAEGVEAIVEIQRRAERYVEAGEWDPYAAALEEAEGTPWAPVAEGFPQDPEAEIWTWVRLNGSFDPLPRWKEVDVPILVVYGEADEADNVPVHESVDRLREALEGVGHEDHTIRVVPEAGHALWAPDATQEDLRLHPDLVELLTGWIHDRSGGKTDEKRCAAVDGRTYRGTARSAVPTSISISSPSGRR